MVAYNRKTLKTGGRLASLDCIWTILIFMSSVNFMLSRVEHEKGFITLEHDLFLCCNAICRQQIRPYRDMAVV